MSAQSPRPERVLITGGAGYVGSNVALALLEAGHELVVLDNLSSGDRALVPDGARFAEGDAGDRGLVAGLIAEHEVTAVMHLAASIDVPESVADPLAYYRNNTCVSRDLIETCFDHGVKSFVFSSSAAVYGAPRELPVSEDAPAAPINPYGASKLMTEVMLGDLAAAGHGDFRHLSLRYFNVAGADPQYRSGQCAAEATNLISVACMAALGLRPELEIYGDDYDTPDGTCVRDYIHVTDIARAHVQALDHLAAGGECLTLNCGYGFGYSVREVVESCERVTGRKLATRRAPRRPGDPPAVVADATRVRERLGWRPSYQSLDFIIETALEWERRRRGL